MVNLHICSIDKTKLIAGKFGLETTYNVIPHSPKGKILA